VWHRGAQRRMANLRCNLIELSRPIALNLTAINDDWRFFAETSLWYRIRRGGCSIRRRFGRQGREERVAVARRDLMLIIATPWLIIGACR